MHCILIENPKSLPAGIYDVIPQKLKQTIVQLASVDVR